MSAERWLPVAGWEDRYEVSDQGRVRSLLRGVVISLFPNNRRGGYLMVRLYADGSKVRRKVHQLVLEAFVGPRTSGQVVRHLNGNPVDNRLVNLTYGTPSENAYDTVRHGRNKLAAATECQNGHPYTESSTRLVEGRRRCRVCERLRSLAYVERQRRRPKSELDHGKIRSYIAGCRCDLCRDASSAAYYRVKARRSVA